MRVFYFLFCWLFCAIVAHAEKEAGIYEALFYYYAYRIEGSVFPDKDQRSIGGLECRSKLCTFNEFVKSWATDTTTVNWLAAGDTTTPVVEGAETTFADMNWVDNTYRMDKLFKQSTKINHLEMFRKMTNRIQECREQADVDSAFLSSATTALKFVQKKRWEANFAKTQKSFNANYAGVTLQVKQQPLSDGTTKTVID
ncbi:hypothetical protein CNMCM5623_004813 [Aspergillus felis]|uniref:Uncharacterized protein n=1 Tax=Aspergillus felis TaxID=1287682 RepID=A0A8H6UNA2_9EURO|nr:hypothetical protein CNMCM5623_004813 [Aspergillus felis]